MYETTITWINQNILSGVEYHNSASLLRQALFGVMNETENILSYYATRTWVSDELSELDTNNIYNSNGTLTGNRNVNLNGYTLTYSDGIIKTEKYSYNIIANNSHPNSTWTDGVDLWFTDNAGQSKKVIGSNVVSGPYNPPTLAQLTSLNIKAGDFYHCSANEQRSLFDGLQLIEWYVSPTQFNALTQAQKDAVKQLKIYIE